MKNSSYPLAPTRLGTLACVVWLVLLVLPVRPAATQEGTFQGGFVALSTDYLYRGISQTRGEATLQAEVDFAWKSLSWFVWGSRVDFGDGGTARTEVDLGLSWTHTLSDHLDLSVGWLHFVYLEERDSDYSELFVSLAGGSFELGVYWAPDYFGTGVEATYLEVGFASDLGAGFEIGLYAGRSLFANEDPGEETPEYWDFRLALRRSLGPFDLELLYSETTLDDDPAARDRVVGTVGVSF